MPVRLRVGNVLPVILRWLSCFKIDKCVFGVAA